MGRVAAQFALAWIVLGTSVVRADSVDEHFVRANEAAQRGDWDEAIAAYEQTAALLPRRNALLSYNLGTAYAKRDELGRATYHLHRATDWRGGPTSEVIEAAQYNLAVVRRRIELQATASGALVDRPETSWDLVVEALRAPGAGWFALISGWAFLGVLFVHRRRQRRGRGVRPVTGTMLVVLASCHVIPGFFYGWAIRADRTSPEAIVLDARVEAREGPGSHRKVEFTLQGGSRVRLVDQSPGWRRVRLPGRVEGWVAEQTVAALEAAQAPGSAAGRQRSGRP